MWRMSVLASVVACIEYLQTTCEMSGVVEMVARDSIGKPNRLLVVLGQRRFIKTLQ